MSNQYILGIDGGTQSTKVVIFDTKGNVICQASGQLRPLSIPEFGIAEHPDDDLWDSLGEVCQAALAKFPYDVKDIIGVGLCSIRCCGVVLKKDGSLANPVLNWMDARLGQKYDHKIPDMGYITTTTGYLTYRMTGNRYDTAANLQNPWWPIDKVKWDWFEEEEKFAPFGVSRDQLFTLKNPGDVVGAVTAEAAKHTGLVEGTPVVITANDKAVEALGAGLRGNKTGLVSLGTFICTMLEGKEYRTDLSGSWSNMACEPNKYIYEVRGVRRGMSTVSWVKDLGGESITELAREQGVSPEDYLNKWAEKVPAGSYGLMTVLEWLGRPQDPFKRGVMIGFEDRHDLGAMFRSVLEGIAMTLKNSMGAAMEELAITPDQIIISGGGSNSDLFMQIFADVFGVKTVRNKVNNSVSMGAAISVAVGLGVYASYDEAIAEMVSIKDSFIPNPENHKLYTRLNKEVYSEITKHTDDLLKKSYEIFKGQ